MQIVFNQISAAEMAAMPVELQLELLAEFQDLPESHEDLDLSRFGQIKRDGKVLYRHRAKEYRLYFAITEQGLLVHRVLHKNTIRDFLFRSELPLTEDEELSKSSSFWKLIEEGKNSRIT